jgi:ADP-ribosyl-[dinitrogen reductase] hydrolase
LSDDVAETAAERDLLAQVARLRSRFQGALFGLAVGEALSAPAIYGRPGAFAPVRDLLGGGPLDLPRGAWAAHMSLALGAARSLLETGGSDPADQRERWRRWQREGEGSATGECLGISASVARALVDGTPDPSLADAADAPARVAPFAMRYLDDREALRSAVRSSASVTCHEPRTLAATCVFADMVQLALRGAAPMTVLAAGDELRSVAWEGSSRPSAVLGAVVEGFADGAGFKETVLRAVNLGGPADAVGALSGQLAGAHYGVESIPAAWVAATAHRSMIADLADALLAEALVGLVDPA